MKNMQHVNRQTGRILDLEKVRQLSDNAMLRHKPELWETWNFEKNDGIGLDIWKMTFGSDKKAWWLCNKCNSDYDMSIKSKVMGKNCSYCTGKRVNHTNSLASLRPEIAKQWHPNRNGELTPHDVTYKSHRKMWWLCDKGHEWEAMVKYRTFGNKCPYCDGIKILKGFNDIWTTNPALASLLADPEDGYRYAQNSNKKVNWKCPECGEIIKDKGINNVNSHRLTCLKCSLCFIVADGKVNSKERYKRKCRD